MKKKTRQQRKRQQHDKEEDNETTKKKMMTKKRKTKNGKMTKKKRTMTRWRRRQWHNFPNKCLFSSPILNILLQLLIDGLSNSNSFVLHGEMTLCNISGYLHIEKCLIKTNLNIILKIRTVQYSNALSNQITPFSSTIFLNLHHILTSDILGMSIWYAREQFCLLLSVNVRCFCCSCVMTWSIPFTTMPQPSGHWTGIRVESM